jgi:hypothetical protein
MKPEELSTFKVSVENNLGYNIENTPNYQNTAINAAMGLHDDGWLYHSNQCQNKNPLPCSYQPLHNPDCCC